MPSVFVPKAFRKSGSYIISKDLMIGSVDGITNLVFPLVIDTEYTQSDWKGMLKNERLEGRRGVTVQMKGIHDGPPLIFAHPDQVAYAEEINAEIINAEEINAGGIKKEIRDPILQVPFSPIDYLKAQGFKAGISQCRIRDPILQTYFAPIDYLKALGFDVEISQCNEADLDELEVSFEICLYAHFALAELFMITPDAGFQEDLLDIVLQKKIIQKNNLQTRRNAYSDSIPMPWIITFDGRHEFRCHLTIIDSSAVHGSVSYAVLCENTGTELLYKDLMDDDIERMDKAYFERPDDFDLYAIGDLSVYEALRANADNFRRVYDSLGIGDYYREPRLTIGATVNHIFGAKLRQLFDIAPGDGKSWKKLSDLFRFGSAGYLRTRTNTTTAWLSKIDGGRCRNNRPTDASIDAPLVDIDLAGCYGESLRSQIYPMGRPIVLRYDPDSEINKMPTLREFLKNVGWGLDGCELISGLWMAKVFTNAGHPLKLKGTDQKQNSTPKKVVKIDDPSPLKHKQDFMTSWFDFNLKNAEASDVPLELQNKTGKTKIFFREIQNGVITHDFVQWLEYVCCEDQRNELLDTISIQAAILYPASERCETSSELRDRISNHEGQNTCTVTFEKGKSVLVDETRECHAWLGVNLGTFIINDLMAWRKCYPKKTPLNQLYKLCINTFYGNSTSSYFEISNVVVGNNITARARAMIWYAEKVLHFVQTITDGGVFELNRVVYPGETGRVTAADLVCLYSKKEPNVRFAPLGGCDAIRLDWEGKTPVLSLDKGGGILVKRGDEASDWVNEAAWLHLQSLFPGVDVLHGDDSRVTVAGGELKDGKPDMLLIPRKGEFDFDMKGFYDYGRFHGAANYKIVNPNETVTAMRGYDSKIRKKKEKEKGEENGEEKGEEKVKQNQTALVVIGGHLAEGSRYDELTPADVFLDGLSSPARIERADAFLRPLILKTQDFVNGMKRWRKTPFVPGDTIYRFGLIKELSLSQFTFNSLMQYKKFDSQHERMKVKFGQGFEAYFVDDGDDRLKYRQMINLIDFFISEDCFDLKRAMKRNRLAHSVEHEHPSLLPLKRARKAYTEATMVRVIRSRGEDYGEDYGEYDGEDYGEYDDEYDGGY